MIFSVQNSNFMYSVKISPDLVQVQVRETVSGVFLARMYIPMQVWHMLEMKQSDFNEHEVAKKASAHYRESFWRKANDGASVEAYGIDLNRHS